MFTRHVFHLGAAALTALLALALPAHAAPPLSGAIFTTTATGSVVNENVHYSSKCEVYLDGGPGQNAPVGAAGLPAGDYYFQVTDPSGKKLLSTDAVSNRKFHVNALGVFSAYTGSGGPAHPTGIDNDHAAQGAITIQLANNTCPADFLDSPNNGGVYKAWVTPIGNGTLAGGGFVGDPTKVDNACGTGCFHGFLPARSKTDNFKVNARTATFCLQVTKETVDSKGQLIGVVSGWPISVTDSLGITNDFSTNTKAECLDDALVGGTYTVTEGLPGGAVVIGLTVNGQPQTASSVTSFNWAPGKPDPFVIVFRNRLP